MSKDATGGYAGMEIPLEACKSWRLVLSTGEGREDLTAESMEPLVRRVEEVLSPRREKSESEENSVQENAPQSDQD
jgi:hypothetical protein